MKTKIHKVSLYLALFVMLPLAMSATLANQEPVHEAVSAPQGESHNSESHNPHETKKTFSLADTLAHHINDQKIKDLHIAGIDASITKRVVMMWIVAFLLIIILVPTARKIAGKNANKPSRLTGLIEVFVIFIRKDVTEGAMGAKHAKNYEKYLLTLFFFILFCNLIGLFPPMGELTEIVAGLTGIAHVAHEGGHHVSPFVALWPGLTATGDLSVNMILAGLSLVMIFIAGFANQGIAFIKNIVPRNIHWSLWPLMWPIEFMGLLIKSAVLAIRLLANMTAGHMIILVLMCFIFQFENAGLIPVSIIGSTAIFMLELFVAFLQAYIFTFLTALFIASAQHRH